MQTLNVDEDWRVRIIGKTLPLPRHKDIILNSMTQTKEKWDSLSRADICMVGRCHGIPCFHFFISLFRSHGKREHMDENDFRHGDGNYFKSALVKVT